MEVRREKTTVCWKEFQKMTWDVHVCLCGSYFLVLLGSACLYVNYVLIETFPMGMLTQGECF